MPSPDVDHARLLLVEDDEGLAKLLQTYLCGFGFEVDHVATGPAGIARLRETQPDLVLLDLMLPGLNGLDVLRLIREEFHGAILMLTASQSEADHVAGLELGADDFVVKPIEPRVLLARIRTQQRRLGGARSATMQDGRIALGPLVVDAASRDVRVHGTLVALTTMEFDVLHHLAAEAGSAVSRDELYARVMGTRYDGIDRGMDVHVSRIRKKLSRAGYDISRLKSVRGVGYLLAAR
jgi:two-component system OmpR family response regulator/two-component system response regulator RstA